MKLNTLLPCLAFLCLTFSAYGQSRFLHDAGENTEPPDVKRGSADQHFPYPIIFIHGLVGSADTWLTFQNYANNQGWSYGGHIRFNLNADNNLYFANLTADIKDFNNGLPAGDYYCINFHCGLNGIPLNKDLPNPSQSNQAAIFKQGVAIQKAIKHVLAATGKDKVILFGHSMGGLAARQYLQNPNIWQADGQHHVAKLVTSGTPHGGSNATGTFLLDAFIDIDERSDAVRDLRRWYSYSFKDGVFLYGGVESHLVMSDHLFTKFYNTDVNCNGFEGDQIIGLNQRNIPTDLDFSCIVGDWLYDFSINDPGDGVVEVEDAQIKNFYNIYSETFEIETDYHPGNNIKYTLHTDLPTFTGYNICALDEPDYYDLSYKVKPNEIYNGFITAQASDGPSVTDYDDFVFTTTQPGWVTVSVGNASTFPFGVSILRHPNYDYIFDKKYQSQSFQTAPIQVPVGTYYLELYANPTTDSWQYPYNFKVNWSAVFPTSTGEQHAPLNVSVSPNPVRDWATVQVATGAYIKHGRLALQNQFGQVLQTLEFEGANVRQQLDLSGLPEGIYFVAVSADGLTRTEKVVKQ